MSDPEEDEARIDGERRIGSSRHGSQVTSVYYRSIRVTSNLHGCNEPS
jgi:hypothetical protein